LIKLGSFCNSQAKFGRTYPAITSSWQGADAEYDERVARRSIWRSLKALTVADPLAAQTQKNKDGLINALYIFDIEMPDAVSEFIFWHCGDLINHESGKSVEAVAFVRRKRNAKQRCLGWIGCHDADRDGFGGIEAVIL
jgi:hypothetical protein